MAAMVLAVESIIWVLTPSFLERRRHRVALFEALLELFRLLYLSLLICGVLLVFLAEVT